nr:UDP-N-acetylmuramoyl-L-alanyl-D-glutamate--2,6-diaminopimelate ligase [Thermoleophilaceae bacterium]
MKLSDVLAREAPDVDVTALAYASDRVEPGALFFCVRGFTADGHEYAPDAVDRGAAALVTDHELGLGVPEVVVEDVRRAMGPAAARFHGDPTATLRVVGITGTNGKTTTAYLIRHLLEDAGIRTGLLGTVMNVVGGVEEDVVRTTPEAIELQGVFRRMLDAGDEACVMEVSSHALALGRVDAIGWAARVFTNLTQDHLDFHSDMEDYFAAKLLLFEGENGERIVNADDGFGRRIPDATTYAIEHEADFRATDVSFDASGSRFTIDAPGGPVPIETPLPGLFNVSNVLAAYAAGRALGVDGRTALRDAARVPGRFEPVDEGQEFAVLVDYAHTPEAIENVLRAARELVRGAPGGSPAAPGGSPAAPSSPGRVHIVFGAGGDRDRRKRPLMG